MSSTAPALRVRVPRLAGAALERARLTVVPKQRRRRSSPVPFLVVVSMLAVGGIVGLLLFNTSMQQASFASTALQNEADVLQARQQSLQMQLDRLRDPQTIALRAQRLGMVLPSSPAVLDLRTGKVLGTPLPATAANRLRLTPPAPAKPALLDPRAKVVVVRPAGGTTGTTGTGTTGTGTAGKTSHRPGRGAHAGTAAAGRHDHAGHTSTTTGRSSTH